METKQQIANLWKEVFHDSDEFISLFFNRVYKPENTLYIEQDNQVVSALQMVPYEIKIGDNLYHSAYVCGVCTRESERGKGLMNKLMSQAMENMKKRGYAITFLIPAEPWLFDFYKKFGYDCLINENIEIYSANENTCKSDYKIIPCNDIKYFQFFDRKQREQRNAVLHNDFDFETIRQDSIAESGNVWIALENETPVGIAFETPDTEKEVFIKDILYDQPSVKEALIQHIINHHNAKTARIRISSPKRKDAHTYSSACILDNQIKELPDNFFMSLMLD